MAVGLELRPMAPELCSEPQSTLSEWAWQTKVGREGRWVNMFRVNSDISKRAELPAASSILLHKHQKPIRSCLNQLCQNTGKPLKFYSKQVNVDLTISRPKNGRNIWGIFICSCPTQIMVPRWYQGMRGTFTYKYPNVQSGSKRKITIIGAVGGPARPVPYPLSFFFFSRTKVITTAPHPQGVLFLLFLLRPKHRHRPFPAEQSGWGLPTLWTLCLLSSYQWVNWGSKNLSIFFMVLHLLSDESRIETQVCLTLELMFFTTN